MSWRFSRAGTKSPILPFHEKLKVLKLVKNILSLFIKLTSTMIFFSTITFCIYCSNISYLVLRSSPDNQSLDQINFISSFIFSSCFKMCFEIYGGKSVSRLVIDWNSEPYWHETWNLTLKCMRCSTWRNHWLNSPRE